MLPNTETNSNIVTNCKMWRQQVCYCHWWQYHDEDDYMKLSAIPNSYMHAGNNAFDDFQSQSQAAVCDNC